MSDNEFSDNENDVLISSDDEDESVPIVKKAGIIKGGTFQEDDEDDDDDVVGDDEDDDDVVDDVIEDDDEDIIEDDEDDDDDIEGGAGSDDEGDESENMVVKKKTKKIVMPTLLDSDDEDDDDEDNEEMDENFLQKFSSDINKNYVHEFHPECIIHNYDEISASTKVVRDMTNIIIDPLHRTIPFLTKYERARVLGQRAKQIEAGARPFVSVPENIIDSYIIAELELQQKKIPFIIRRPIPGGAFEYWSLKDLEIVAF